MKSAIDAKPSPDARTLDQVGTILSEIASLALAVTKLGNDIELGPDTDDSADTRFDSYKGLIVSELAGKIGWLSDLAAGKIGALLYNGDATTWMLPPAYHHPESLA